MQPLWGGEDDELPTSVGSSGSWLAPWYAPFLDASAGLLWLQKTSTICVACALVYRDDEVVVIATCNISPFGPALDDGAGVSDLGKAGCEMKLRPYRDSWNDCTKPQLLKSLKPKGGGSTNINTQIVQAIANTLFDAPRSLRPLTAGGHMHAEMRILEMLFDEDIQPVNRVVYIGLSAVCCDNCYRAIMAFNFAAEDGSLGYSVAVFGHHSMQYSPGAWPTPNFLSGAPSSSAQKTRFGQRALAHFFDNMPGGKSAFLSRGDHQQDESQHHRPGWDVSGEKPSKQQL